MTTTYCTAADLLNMLRQYDYGIRFDTDDDGNADTAAITFAIEQGAIKLNHFNTNFPSDSKKAANMAFAAEVVYSMPDNSGQVPNGIQSQIDFWTAQCEAYSTTPHICQMYNPEEGITSEYLDELIEDPE